MTPGPTLQDLIATVLEDSPSRDLLDQLATASTTVSELEDVGDALLGYFVDQCRRSGRSWSDISGALGVSKQAAHKRFNLGTPTLERFTERARHAFREAQDAARRLGHNYVGTEHLLLGLLAFPECLAAKVLAEGGVTPETVEAKVPRGDADIPAAQVIPLTPRSAEVFTACLSEALTLGHNYVGTEHVLLALFRDPDALGCRILVDLGVTRDHVRGRIVEILSGYKS